jgi:nucleoside-diphosphate-sugar epimerase
MYPIHIDDASGMMHRSVFVEQEKNRVIHVNGGEAITYADIIKLASRITGRRSFIIPLPRWLLSMVSAVGSIFKIDIGFVPDQVDRLYSNKESGQAPENFISLELYMKTLHEK